MTNPEPTEAMVEAGRKALADASIQDTLMGDGEIAARVYRAMVTASPPVDHGRVEIPRDIAEQVLSMGRVEWGATDELNEAGHIEHLATSLRLTREHFNFEDVPVAMHGLYLEGTGTILCHTGTSPNSGPNAQALAGAWNWLLDLAALTNKDTTS